MLTLSLCILTEEVKKFKKIKVLTFTLCILKKEIKKKNEAFAFKYLNYVSQKRFWGKGGALSLNVLKKFEIS